MVRVIVCEYSHTGGRKEMFVKQERLKLEVKHLGSYG